ncbi:MAG TPA: hypothetical protein VF322_00375 [Gammaproteobacteria bacterium]
MVAALIMVVTFVFGIVPATFLLAFALLSGVVGLVAVASSVWVGAPGMLLRGLVFIPATVMAVYGYKGLFFAAGQLVTPRVARWLFAGIIATVAYIGFLAAEPAYQVLDAWYFYFSPTIVGAAHLVGFLVRSRQRRASV